VSAVRAGLSRVGINHGLIIRFLAIIPRYCIRGRARRVNYALQIRDSTAQFSRDHANVRRDTNYVLRSREECGEDIVRDIIKHDKR